MIRSASAPMHQSLHTECCALFTAWCVASIMQVAAPCIRRQLQAGCNLHRWCAHQDGDEDQGNEDVAAPGFNGQLLPISTLPLRAQERQQHHAEAPCAVLLGTYY